MEFWFGKRVPFEGSPRNPSETISICESTAWLTAWGLGRGDLGFKVWGFRVSQNWEERTCSQNYGIFSESILKSLRMQPMKPTKPLNP